MIFSIRHGERADDSFSQAERKKIVLSFDPPLTTIGIQESIQTGKHLLNIFKQKNIIPIIFSSPFLRCFETAYHISKSLDKTFESTIFVENGLSEYLHGTFFERLVLDDLTIRNNGKIEEGFKIRFNMISKEIKHKIDYPEIYSDFFRRTQECVKLIETFYLENFDIDRYAVVMVTHGYGIQCFLNDYMAIQRTKNLDYCCISLKEYKNKNDKPEIVLKGCGKHLLNFKSKL